MSGGEEIEIAGKGVDGVDGELGCWIDVLKISSQGIAE